MSSVPQGHRQSEQQFMIPPSLRSHIQLALDAARLFEQTRNPLPLDDAIVAWENILAHADFASTDPGFRLVVLNDCAGSFLRRYLIQNNLEDINRAINYMQNALDQVPPDTPLPPSLLVNLGEVLLVRYRHATATHEGDLDQAIELYKQAIVLTPVAAPDFPARSGKLANALESRYQRTHDFSALESAILYHKQAIERTPLDDPALPERLNNLGDCLRTRYLYSNEKADLDQAVALGELVVHFHTLDPLDRAGYLNNLGNALRSRYESHSDTADLERAVQVYREAVANVPAHSPYEPMFIHNLGVALRDRYYLLGEKADIVEAMDYLQRAVDTSPPQSELRPGYLSDLGTALDDWFQRTGALEELERSIQTHWQAVHQTPENAPALALHWNNLGNALRNFATRSGKEADLTQAIEAYREAVAHTPPSSYYRASRLNNLANALKDRFIRTTAIEDLQQSLRFYEQALKLLKPDATEYAVELYERYQQAVTAWEKLSRGMHLGEETFSARIPSAESIRAARENFNSVVALVRAVPGYEDFFASPTFSRIHASVLPASSLVYIVVTEHGGLALHVQAETPTVTSLFLPELTKTVVRQKVLEMSAALEAYARLPGNHAVQLSCFQQMDTITSWLWSVLMGSTIDTFPLKSSVTLISTGLLALLPLHAAWTDDLDSPTKRRYALDRITFTSIPNARALASVRERALQATDDALLVVDDPQPVAEPLGTEGYEAEFARMLFPRHTLLRHEQATLDTVLRETLLYPVWHFNCHGYADVVNPLASGLVMAEKQPLTLQHLLDLHLTHARLAVLSACETALPGIALPNEVISLPMGLLQAGFVGVIASLWKVEYTSTMLLMIRFYDLWQKQAIAAPEALRQAQLWLRDTTTSQKLAYIEHFSMEEGFSTEKANQLYEYVFIHVPRTCAYPYYWAAFNYMGI